MLPTAGASHWRPPAAAHDRQPGPQQCAWVLRGCFQCLWPHRRHLPNGVWAGGHSQGAVAHCRHQELPQAALPQGGSAGREGHVCSLVSCPALICILQCGWCSHTWIWMLGAHKLESRGCTFVSFACPHLHFADQTSCSQTWTWMSGLQAEKAMTAQSAPVGLRFWL